MKSKRSSRDSKRMDYIQAALVEPNTEAVYRWRNRAGKEFCGLDFRKVVDEAMASDRQAQRWPIQFDPKRFHARARRIKL